VVEVGSTIGNYEVLQKVGQGAMGAVYMARHPVIGKRVALKVIHPDLAMNDEMVSRFFNEARAVTQIGHPNIVDVQDFGQTPTGDSFIVMELLEGIGLGTLIKQQGQLPIERAVHIGVQIAEGLRAAHARGIIHRDLKPDNIFIIQRGNEQDFVKILDFGLAKLTGPGAMSHKTRTGAVLGTAHYMAPEAAEDARKVDHRVDVYALGCILFEMIIGRVPFPGDGFGAVLVRHVREPPPLPTRLRADVPAWLEKIILHALAKKADFRFASMEEFGHALRDPSAWQRGLEVSPHDPHFDATSVRVSTPQPMEAVAAPRVRSGPMRASQLPADAKTMAAPLPATPTEYQPGPPASWLAAQKAGVVPDGTAELNNPSGMITSNPEVGAESLVRRRTASALGIAAIALGAAALIATVAGAVHHVWFSHVVLSVLTDPPGVEVLIGNTTVAHSPAQVKVVRGKEPLQVLLQKAGYVTVRRAIEPRADLALDVTLLPEPRPVAPPVAAPDPPDEPPAPPPPVVEETKPGPRVVTKVAAKSGSRGEPKARVEAKRPRKKAGEAFKTDGLLLAPTF
jgi:serine/threonine protein kinase